MYYDDRGNENNSSNSAGDFFGSANTWNGYGVCSSDDSIPPTKTKVLIVEKCQQNANLATLANETLTLSKLPRLLRLSFLVLLKFC